MSELLRGHPFCGTRQCKRHALLKKLYRRRRLRPLCLWYAKRKEGGRFHSRTLRELIRDFHGVEVGAYTYGGKCLVPDAWPAGVSIGRYVSIAAGVRVFLRNHPTNCLSTHPFFFNDRFGLADDSTVEHGSLRIEHDAWIGENALITAGCSRIGVGAVVGAGAVVTKDVPDFAIVAGNPAKLIRHRFAPPIQEAVLESKWWELPYEELKAHQADLVAPLGDEPLANGLLRLLLQGADRSVAADQVPAAN